MTPAPDNTKAKMKTKKTGWVARFDEEFIQDRKGMSVYALSNDIKYFIQDLLDSQRKELLSKLPKEMSERIEVNPDFVRIGYNQCLSEVRDILTKE